MSYKIKELAVLLSKTEKPMPEKTFLRWIGEGLKTVPGGKNPIYIYGSDLKEFIRNKDSKKKVKLGRYEYYCFHCKKARRAKRGSIRKSKNRKMANCCVCNGKMSRTFKPYQKDYKIPPVPV